MESIFVELRKTPICHVGRDQKRMTGILLTTSSELAASQMARQRQTRRKNIARAEQEERLVNRRMGFCREKEKRNWALRPTNYP